MTPDVQIAPTHYCAPQAVPAASLGSIGCSDTNGQLPMVAAHPPILSDLAAFAASVEFSASRSALQCRPSRVESIRSSREVQARTTKSYLWALAPLLTFGMATVPCFVFAAHRLRRKALYVAVAAYSALTVLMVWGGSTDSQTNLQSDVGSIAVMFLVTLSTAHALVIRRSLFFENDTDDGLVAVARARMRRREQARRIAAKDPILARELKIGRPDQSSAYDDGGLVDVNHVPVGVLCAIEGIGPELATAIVDARRFIGRFNSREDLEATLGLDPYALDGTSDLLVFLR